ncbi:hypothetical protein GCM10010525_04430 [Glutamicibacter bergerei]
MSPPAGRNHHINGEETCILKWRWELPLWHLLANGEVFKENGPNFYVQRNESHSKIKPVKELERLGYDVQLVSIAP